MFYHGHLTHPDIWTMWFSLAVSAVTVLGWIVRLILWLTGRSGRSRIIVL